MPDSIQAKVRADLEERERLGIERYGTALYANNGRDALRDAYEESLDQCQYLRQAIEERDMMKEQSPEVVAAALALAEASTKIRHLMQHAGSDDSRAWAAAEAAYRAAIAPKLRTRATLTLEQRVARLERASEMASYRGRVEAQREIRDDLERAASEQTAPEPDRKPEPEDACGCDASDALREQLRRVQTEIQIWYDGKQSCASAMAAMGAIMDAKP